jgi:hypothetical protein
MSPISPAARHGRRLGPPAPAGQRDAQRRDDLAATPRCFAANAGLPTRCALRQGKHEPGGPEAAPDLGESRCSSLGDTERRTPTRSITSSEILGETLAQDRRGKTPSYNRAHEAQDFPLVAPPRRGRPDRHRVELLAAGDHGDRQRSQGHARAKSLSSGLRAPDAHAADRRSQTPLRALPPGLPRLRLECAPCAARTASSRRDLGRLPPPLRGLSPGHDGPARVLADLHRHAAPALPHPHPRRCEHGACLPCFDGRASRCSA